MKKEYSAMLWVLVCTLFTSVAQLFYKAGAGKLSLSLVALITNWQIITGLALYGIGAIILIRALKSADLSLLYPIIATSYIWVTLFSFVLFKEAINAYKAAGVAVIIAGVICMGLGSKKSPGTADSAAGNPSGNTLDDSAGGQV